MYDPREYFTKRFTEKVEAGKWPGFIRAQSAEEYRLYVYQVYVSERKAAEDMLRKVVEELYG